MRFFHSYCRQTILAAFLTLVVAGPLLIQTAHSQATNEAGAIQGTVTDPSGAVVPGATVTITDTAKGSQNVLKTTSSGFYVSEALEPGKYALTIEAPGFSTAKLNLVVQVGQTANGSIKLGLQGTVTEVQVEDTAVQVDTTTSSVQGVLNRQEIETLPLNGRNFLDMAQLQPGVQIQDGTSFDPTKNGFSSIPFGGRFGRTARITMDGVDISDENVGTTTQNILRRSDPGISDCRIELGYFYVAHLIRFSEHCYSLRNQQAAWRRLLQFPRSTRRQRRADGIHSHPRRGFRLPAAQ